MQIFSVLLTIASCLDDRGWGTLSELFSDAIKLSGRLNRYRVSFTADYSFLNVHASPTVENYAVIFAQVYSSTVNMARPIDFGLLDPYLICREYPTVHRTFAELGNETRQYLHDLIVYCKNYYTKRILSSHRGGSLDTRKSRHLSQKLNRQGVFDVQRCTLVADFLLASGLLDWVSSDNWMRHMNVYTDTRMSVSCVALKYTGGTSTTRTTIFAPVCRTLNDNCPISCHVLCAWVFENIILKPHKIFLSTGRRLIPMTRALQFYG